MAGTGLLNYRRPIRTALILAGLALTAIVVPNVRNCLIAITSVGYSYSWDERFDMYRGPDGQWKFGHWPASAGMMPEDATREYRMYFNTKSFGPHAPAATESVLSLQRVHLYDYKLIPLTDAEIQEFERRRGELASVLMQRCTGGAEINRRIASLFASGTPINSLRHRESSILAVAMNVWMEIGWWWLLPIAVFPLTLAWCARRRYLARASEGKCPACGYDMAGNTTGKCPECGEIRLSAY